MWTKLCQTDESGEIRQVPDFGVKRFVLFRYLFGNSFIILLIPFGLERMFNWGNVSLCLYSVLKHKGTKVLRKFKLFLFPKYVFQAQFVLLHWSSLAPVDAQSAQRTSSQQAMRTVQRWPEAAWRTLKSCCFNSLLLT